MDSSKSNEGGVTMSQSIKWPVGDSVAERASGRRHTGKGQLSDKAASFEKGAVHGAREMGGGEKEKRKRE